MHIDVTQLNIQLFFKEPVFQDQSKLAQTLLGYGFSLAKGKSEHHNEHKVTAFIKDSFRVSVVTSNVLPDRILQIVLFSNNEPERTMQNFLSALSDILLKEMNVNTNDLDACRVVFHAIVKSDRDTLSVLEKINDISSISSLSNYAVHKNPFKALQLTEKIGNKLEHEEWQDIRINAFDTNSYVVTIYHESVSTNRVLQFLGRARNFVSKLINDIEASA